VVEIFQVDEALLTDLEESEVLCPLCEEGTSVKQFPLSDMEKLRIAKFLMEDLEVNLPGVEIVLRMRQTMIDMRAQFDAILEDLAGEFRRGLRQIGPDGLRETPVRDPLP
jgi:MerR family transcriptional regulator/heat shock protein HspR